MTPSDRHAFLQVVLGMCELRAKTLSSAGLELYWNAMADWTLAEFKAVAQQLIQTCQFMPTPFDFEKARRAARGQGADEAWHELLTNHGQCSDPVGARALRSLGGWTVVGFANTDKLPWLKERFREAYQNFEDAQNAQRTLTLARQPSHPAIGVIR